MVVGNRALAAALTPQRVNRGANMPLKRTIEKAQRDKREGKSASTQASEFVREEIDKIRHGEHGARSAKQAIAIGLSEARRAGVDLPPPKGGKPASEPAKALNMPMMPGRGFANPSAASVDRGRRCRRSSANRATPSHRRHCRGKRTARRRSELPHNVPHRRERRFEPRAPRLARPPPKKARERASTRPAGSGDKSPSLDYRWFRDCCPFLKACCLYHADLRS